MLNRVIDDAGDTSSSLPINRLQKGKDTTHDSSRQSSIIHIFDEAQVTNVFSSVNTRYDTFSLRRLGFTKLAQMIFDDYLWREKAAKKRNVLDEPKPAIDAFLNVFAHKMSVIPHAPIYQLYAEKLAN